MEDIMDFLKNSPRFSFKYGDTAFADVKKTVSSRADKNVYITEYILEDGLKITNVAKKHDDFDAYEWVNYIENTGGENSKVISELWDCDCEFPCEYQPAPPKSAIYPSLEKDMIVLNPQGSNVDEFDFYTHIDESSADKKIFLFEGGEKNYKNMGGRSSEGLAPFFNVHQNKKGWIIGIGWSGQWNFRVSRKIDTVRFQSKIEDTHFYLEPGEKIRTSSVVIMSYEDSLINSQNKWRRLLLKHYASPLDRVDYVPMCFAVWGGMKSADVIERIETLDKANVPYEYLWMDAGWHGNTTSAGNNAFDGDWGDHVGEWFPCPDIHPRGLVDVAEKIKEKGKKFLLWFEIERAVSTTELGVEHPDWLLETLERPRKSRLFNFGNPDAFEYALELLSDIIRKLDIKCYRQDTNILPLLHWRKYDTEDRLGITEIKHVMGLYKLWDSLLERFPDLIIDNCASGGTRLDMELIPRSVSLCRSDCQCFDNLNPEITQVHNMNFSTWVPLTATFTGMSYDNYRMRSTYATGIQLTYTFDGLYDFGNDPEKMSWLKKMCEEYIAVRKYFYGDIYPLTKPIKDSTSWCVTQWDRPEHKDGMLQVFKRENSPYVNAVFALHKIDPSRKYLFTDLDGGEFTIEGSDLAENGLSLTIKEKQVAKIYIYKVI